MHYAGTDLHEVREKLLEDLDQTRDSMNQAMHDIISVAQSAIGGESADEGKYVLAGETHLMDFAELSDVETLRRLFEAFSRKRLMLDLLDRLRPIDGEVLRLRLWEEATFDEIAGVLGCSRHAAEQRYRKALIRLRSLTSGHGSGNQTAADERRQERKSEA